jgi:hypothetical protein
LPLISLPATSELSYPSHTNWMLRRSLSPIPLDRLNFLEIRIPCLKRVFAIAAARRVATISPGCPIGGRSMLAPDRLAL